MFSLLRKISIKKLVEWGEINVINGDDPALEFSKTLEVAIKGGHGWNAFLDYVIGGAGAYDNLVHWALKNEYVEPDICIRLSVEKNNFILLRWLYQRYPENASFKHCVSNWAAEAGNLTILKWAKKNNFIFDVDVCTYAAIIGNLDMLVWARKPKHNCPWNASVFYYAVNGAHWKLLEWALRNNCETMVNANIDMKKLAKANKIKMQIERERDLTNLV